MSFYFYYSWDFSLWNCTTVHVFNSFANTLYCLSLFFFRFRHLVWSKWNSSISFCVYLYRRAPSSRQNIFLNLCWTHKTQKTSHHSWPWFIWLHFSLKNICKQEMKEKYRRLFGNLILFWFNHFLLYLRIHHWNLKAISSGDVVKKNTNSA